MLDRSRLTVAIRVDASTRIGTGHVIRCLSLAGFLRSEGAEVFFLSRLHEGNLVGLIQENGYEVVALGDGTGASDCGREYEQWLGVSWQEDARDTLKSLASRRVDWLVVDHYGLSDQWEGEVRSGCRALMVIDDLLERRHRCELLVDQNLQMEGVDQRARVYNSTAEFLIGPKYAMLRSAFRDRREEGIKTRDGNPRRVVLFFGGTDPTNETMKALRAFALFPKSTFEIEVVVGTLNPHRQAIASHCMEFGYHMHVGANMARLYARADLAIGAPGTSTWERLCMGVPSALVGVAENQERIGQVLDEEGYAFYLGRSCEVSVANYEELLRALPYLRGELGRQSRRGLSLVDGHGASRVAARMLHWWLPMRRADEHDSRPMYEWRNSEGVRRWSSDPNAISFDDHEAWIRRSLLDPRRILLIGEETGEPVGVVRFDLEDENAVISIYVRPGLSGKGFGATLLRNSTQWLRKEYPGIRNVTAEVLEGNSASMSLFLEAGYRRVSARHCLTLD